MASTNTTALSEREREILVLAWESFKNQPQVDYAKLKELGGFKTVASANSSFLAAKKKMLASNATKISAHDRELIVMAWNCFKSAPEVDYKQLQQKGKYKTVASANSSYLAVRKKLLGDVSAPSPAQADGKKRKAASEYEAPNKRTKTEKIDAMKTASESASKAPSVDEDGERLSVKLEPKTEAEEDESTGANLLASAQKYLEDTAE
ncbi:hypothetical protein LTR37_014791 [Vermiconidia calcicola]|uniref:Uncharacterized protein n=1 Tax=Vermiconidia calcicola TaxID=1690605 RepID=A0ACC3MT49_9PEZI|nr:hypothetical protein LTR37_014791 [Vermiconidia calcicola]